MLPGKLTFLIDFDCCGTGKRKQMKMHQSGNTELKKVCPALGKNKAPRTDLIKYVMIEAEITKLSKVVPSSTARPTNWALVLHSQTTFSPVRV